MSCRRSFPIIQLFVTCRNLIQLKLPQGKPASLTPCEHFFPFSQTTKNTPVVHDLSLFSISTNNWAETVRTETCSWFTVFLRYPWNFTKEKRWFFANQIWYGFPSLLNQFSVAALSRWLSSTIRQMAMRGPNGHRLESRNDNHLFTAHSHVARGFLIATVEVLSQARRVTRF